MSKRDEEYTGEDEVIEVEGTEVVTDSMVSDKELEARAKKEARAKEWAENKAMIRARKEEMYEVLLANGFDKAYCDGLQKIIGEEHVARAKKAHSPRIALRDQFIALFGGVIGTVVKGLDIYLSTAELGGMGKDKLNILCADAIRKASKPEDRVWIKATPDADNPMLTNYTLVGIGADAPEGWDGFLPSETL